MPNNVAVLVPQTNVMVENDFFSMFAENEAFSKLLSPHFSRIRIPTRYKTDKNGYLDDAFDNFPEAAGLFGTLDIGAYAFMCTSAAMRQIHKTGNFPESHLGKPFLHPLGSLRYAVRHLRTKKLLMISPYDDAYTQMTSDWIRNAGVEVKDIALNTDYQLPSFTNDKIIAVAKEHASWGADMVYIPCTNFNSIMTIEAIEAAWPETIVTNSNQVVVFHLMKMFGAEPFSTPRYGRIFAR